MLPAQCPVRVSTITANGDLGTAVHLQTFFDQLDIVPYGKQGIIWAKYSNQVKGVHPDPKKKISDSPNKHFNHQVTIVYYLEERHTPNLKIFYTGNVQMTGVKGFDIGPALVDRVADELRRISEAGHPGVVKDLGKLEGRDFVIRMINSDFKLPYEIRRKELYNILLEHYSIVCSYQPESYPGVKLNYFWNPQKTGMCTCEKFCMGRGNGIGDGNCKKVTISLFRSGSVLITGATSYEQVCNAYDFIQGVLRTFENQIRWNFPIGKLAAPAPVVSQTVVTIQCD